MKICDCSLNYLTKQEDIICDSAACYLWCDKILTIDLHILYMNTKVNGYAEKQGVGFEEYGMNFSVLLYM
jgi:hypothetical protein